ncbi:MAG: hypothetical protein OXH31_00835 [Gammaproteobacteria bacterium]|nr:hypothetical protein [Gammaproteobacteria bacterium]
MTTTNEQLLTASKRNLILAITFALGLVLGILAVIAVQNFDSQRETHTRQDTAQRDVQLSSQEPILGGPAEVTVDVGEFQKLLDHRSSAELYKALYARLSLANETELIEWWTHAQKIERKSHREIARQVIIGNLSAINPQEALRLLNEVSVFSFNNLIATLFREWSVLGLEEAVETATTLPGPSRTVALQAILETRDDLSEEQQRTIAKQLKDEEYFLMLVSETNASKSLADPQESWNILLNDDVDDSSQTESFSKVAEVWTEQIGFEVLSKIYEMQDFGINVDLVSAIGQLDLSDALDYTRGLSDENAKQSLSRIIVRDWARTDPKAALAASLTFEPSSVASTLEGVVALTWARTAPLDFIENIETISERPRLLSLEIAFSTIARKEPRRAIAMLSSVESYVGNTSSILNRVVDEWAEQQPDTAADWILNNFTQEDPQRQLLLVEVLPRVARRDPYHAFELAMEQPIPSEGFELEFYVMQEIVYGGDIEVAKELLPRVREKSKPFVYDDVGRAMVDVGQTSEALKLGQDLEESDQSSFYLTVLDWWVFQKPTNFYESLESLPSSDIKSLAARQLVLRNQLNPIFTNEQIEQARTFLNSEDKALLERMNN